MSVVPYNLNNRVIYRYPDHGVLVVHNKADNTLQLITQNNGNQVSVFNLDEGGNGNGVSGLRRGSVFDDESFLECPNCGFSWTTSQSYGGQGSGTGGPATGKKQNERHHHRLRRSDFGEFGEFGSAPVLGGGSRGGLFDQEFMHQDYFKLLSRLPASGGVDSGGTGSTSSEPEIRPPKGLPEQIFNQDYFKRFFRKVPPYELGSGAHALVYKVVHVLNNIPLGTYAVKRISIGDKIEFLEQVLKEVLILYELSLKGANENNLIRYNHVWLELGDILDLKAFVLPASESSAPELHKKVPYVFILQQYCDGGDLEGIIKNNFPLDAYSSYKDRVERERIKRRLRKRKTTTEIASESVPLNGRWLNEFEIWKFFKDVITGVSYLHVHGILHRDLKPSNCLLEAKYEINSCRTTFASLEEFEAEVQTMPKVLVSDFGEGKFTDKHSIVESDGGVLSLHENKERKGNTGTLEFTAPELWMLSVYDPASQNLLKENRFTHDFTYESDIYLLGMILCWLCLGQLPFSAAIQSEQDPEASRNKIIDWYKHLTLTQFNEWFAENKKVESGAMDEFGLLIYLMIKGHDRVSEDHNRVLLPDVVGLIDEFKTKYFIDKDISVSSVTTTAATGADVDITTTTVAAAAATTKSNADVTTTSATDTDELPPLENIDSRANEDSLSIRDVDTLDLVTSVESASSIPKQVLGDPFKYRPRSGTPVSSAQSGDLIGSYVSILVLATAVGTADALNGTHYVILTVLMGLMVDTYIVDLWHYRKMILTACCLLVLGLCFNVFLSLY